MKFFPIEEKMLSWLSNDTLSETDKIRLRYGFYLVSDAIKKGIVIYTPVIFLGLFLEVLIVHLSFFILRQVTFGWHGRTSLECIFFSIIGFIVLPFIVSQFTIPTMVLYIVSLFIFGQILSIGPRGTQVNTLDNDETGQLRKKLLIRVFLLFGLFLIIPVSFKSYLLLGAAIQLVALFVQMFLNHKSNLN